MSETFAHPLLAVAGGGLCAALACGSPIPDSEDSAACAQGCTSELTLELGTDSFQLILYGSEFNTLQAACPDGIYAGGPGGTEVECQATGLVIRLSDLTFPETLTISVDGSAEESISPDWEDLTVCDLTCNTALQTL